jgi:hypothetical protein
MNQSSSEQSVSAASVVPARVQMRTRHEVDMLVPAVNGSVP